MNNFVSVIIPVYNSEKTLSRCLESVLKQSYQNYEVLIINDGSSDQTGKICDIYKKKYHNIKVFYKDNGGVSSARNVGINNSNGNLLFFIDADDYIETNTLEKMVEKIDNNDIVISGYDIVRDSSKKFKSSKIYSNFLDFICYNYMWAPWGKLVRKEVIKDLFDEKKHVGEDLLFWVLNSKNINKYTYIDEPLYNYYINNESVMHNKNKNIDKHATVLDSYIDVALILNDSLKKFFIMQFIYTYLQYRSCKKIKDKYKNIYKDYYKCIKRKITLKEKIKIDILKICPNLYVLLKK